MKLKEISGDRLIAGLQTALEKRQNCKVLDPFRLCEKYGITVSFIDIETPFAYSIYNPIKGNYDVYISDHVDRYSSKILCYHELGHILCDSKENTYLFDHTIDQEGEFIANYFMLLFMPQVLSRQKVTSEATIEAINEYIATQIRTKESTDMPGQWTLFDIISLDDEYWTHQHIDFLQYKKTI